MKREKVNYKKLAKRGIERLSYDIYFSPKLRQSVRETSWHLKKILSQCWNATDEELKQQNLDRGLVVTAADVAAKGLVLTEIAEKWAQGRRLRDKKFFLYQSKSGKKNLLESSFFKVVEGKHKKSSWVFPKGLPQNDSKVEVLWYREKLSKVGYNLIEKGTFFQRLPNFQIGIFTFKNRKFFMRLKIWAVNKRDTSFPSKIWVKKIG